jgi:hypothetical protein
MYTITAEQYENKPKEYKSVYGSDEIHGTNFNGKKTLLIWEPGSGTTLLIEGQSFKIVETEKENINPIL